MSLRSRLLIAIGVIALAALAIADVVTYKSLESFLYNRVDQQLDQSSVGFSARLNQGWVLSSHYCDGPAQFGPASGTNPDPDMDGDGGQAPAATGDDADNPPGNAVQEYALEVRSSTGVIAGQSCPAYVNDVAYTPAIPRTITGFTNQHGGQVAYFTVAAVQSGGPDFRVRACKLATGKVLVVAQPIGDTGGTLHQLLLTELAVTGGAVIVALMVASGWYAWACAPFGTWRQPRRRSPPAT
jgi:hypothetical protein